MSNEKDKPFEMPADVRVMAERSIGEAKKAFDQVMLVAKSNMGAVEDRGKAVQESLREIGATVAALTEQNMTSAFEHAEKLMKATDPQTLIQLQVDYIKNQMQSLTEQGRTLADAVSKAAKDVSSK